MDTPPSPHECKILPFKPAAAPRDVADRQPGVPRRILLGTDLGIRSERALGRAAALSDEWDAEFLVMHVADPAGDMAEPPPRWRSDGRERAWQTLLADVGAVTRKATVLMGEGAPGDIIAQTAAAERCDLVVLGVSQEAFLGRVLLDRTVDRVLRRVDVPVLVVKERPRRPYDHIVVATDFSEASRTALDAAATMFPERRLTVFHAYEDDGPRGLARRMALGDCDDFVSDCLAPARRPPRLVVEEGWPPTLLRDYGHAAAVDLVVLGMQKRSQIREIILGSIAKSIMDEVTCDLLVVPETWRGRGVHPTTDDDQRLDPPDDGGETGRVGT